MPIPALIGAGAAIIGSGIQAYGNYKAQEEERKARERAAKELKAAGQLTDDEYRQVLSNIDSYYQNRGSL